MAITAPNIATQMNANETASSTHPSGLEKTYRAMTPLNSITTMLTMSAAQAASIGIIHLENNRLKDVSGVWKSGPMSGEEAVDSGLFIRVVYKV